MTGQLRRNPGSSGEANGSRGRGIRRRGLAVAGAAIGIAACVVAGWMVLGNGTDAAEDARASGDRPVAATDDELLHRASERLIARCMARHGFAYAEQPPPSTEPDLPSVLGNAGWARKYGYGALFRDRGGQGKDANARILARLTPDRQDAWHQTLMGSGQQLVVDLPGLGRLSTSDNGCTAEARRKLYGNLAGWYRARRTVDHFGSYVDDEVVATSEYRTGLAAWAKCVRERGYVASTPRGLRRLVASVSPESAGGQAQRQEIAAAVTEAECGTSTGFSKTSAALERKYRPEIERRFARELDALKSFELKALPRAKRVLAES